MVIMNEYKNLSKKVKLLLSREEGYDVDWKRNVKGLSSKDIVAFANSKNGGSILIGVDEQQAKNGRQQPNIVGCKISDENKMSIKTKALNCNPPIEVEIINENTDKMPFYRLEIPSGDNKPYCTQQGVYKIRDDGLNKAITPNKLLSIFIELESDKFLKRFKEAADEIENNIAHVSRDIKEALFNLENILPTVESLEELNYIPDEILGYVENIDSEVKDINSSVDWNEKRIMSLLNHFSIEDPKITNLKQIFKGSLTLHMEAGTNIQDEKFLESMEKTFFGATKEQLELWRDELIEEINEHSDI